MTGVISYILLCYYATGVEQRQSEVVILLRLGLCCIIFQGFVLQAFGVHQDGFCGNYSMPLMLLGQCYFNLPGRCLQMVDLAIWLNIVADYLAIWNLGFISHDLSLDSLITGCKFFHIFGILSLHDDVTIFLAMINGPACLNDSFLVCLSSFHIWDINLVCLFSQ